jgi:hypothetical protein
MRTSIVHTTRAATAAVAMALTAAVLAAPSATAATDDLTYSCDYRFRDVEGTGEAVAWFDTRIGEGLVVEVGEYVGLGPPTGQLTFPDGLVQALRDAGVEEISGARPATTGEGTIRLTVILEETGEEIGTPGGELAEELGFSSGTPIPAEGPLVVELGGEPFGFEASYVGTNHVVAGDFRVVEVQTGPDCVDGVCGNSVPEVFMDCTLTGEGDATIVAVEVVAAPTPTVPDATGGPARPELVQTDQPQSDPSALPLVALGLGAAAALGGGVAAARAARGKRH